ncbi:MAG: hypothetical protein HOW73_28820 [Polyangiaceae bacterium]|nr:hypothetical protein [Polyangiaceae bacterium]
MTKHGVGVTRGVIGSLGLVLAMAGACSDDTSTSSGAGGQGGGGSDQAGGTGGTNVGGAGGDAAGGGGNPQECVGTSYTGQLRPLDLFIMLDQSGSMDTTVEGGLTRWQAVTNAITGFVEQPDPSGLSVGIQYFGLPPMDGSCPPSCATSDDCPAGESCDPIVLQCDCAIFASDSCNYLDYASAEVEIAPLPGVASQITDSLAAHQPYTGTPTAPALQGGAEHCKEWAIQNPDHIVVHVFATDGEPGECDTDINNIAAIASEYANGEPRILTFVIGVGPGLQNLNQIAAAGGTGQAYLIDTNADAEQQFIDALNEIRFGAVACQYAIPQPDQGPPDYDEVNVKYTPGAGGEAIDIPRVESDAACPTDGADGWYYDDPVSPSQIVLCGDTCTKLSQDLGAKVDIVLGCTTITR